MSSAGIVLTLLVKCLGSCRRFCVQGWRWLYVFARTNNIIVQAFLSFLWHLCDLCGATRPVRREQQRLVNARASISLVNPVGRSLVICLQIARTCKPLSFVSFIVQSVPPRSAFRYVNGSAVDDPAVCGRCGVYENGRDHSRGLRVYCDALSRHVCSEVVAALRCASCAQRSPPSS
jgi:hypothetical protein